MLFDLRGRGRRNVIKVVYVALAFLMGGGLVLFGIGGNTGGGGLVDAFTDGNGATGEGDYDKQIADARARLQANPNDEKAYGDLIRAQVSRASTGDKIDPNTLEYTEEGQADLTAATESWQDYQAIDPKNTEEEASLASRVVEAYRGLGDLQGLVAVQEIVAENRNAVGPYAALAEYAYAAGQIRKGDLAAAKAVELEDPDQRATLKSDLESLRESAAPAASVAPVVTAEPKDEEPADGAKKKATGKKKSGSGKAESDN